MAKQDAGAKRTGVILPGPEPLEKAAFAERMTAGKADGRLGLVGHVADHAVVFRLERLDIDLAQILGEEILERRDLGGASCSWKWPHCDVFCDSLSI